MAQDTTAGGYCATHDRHYSKLEQCADCRAARSVSVRAGSPKADSSKLREVAARYRLREMACWNEFKRYSSVLLPGEESDEEPVKADPHAAVKFSAESGKWAGRADELEARIVELEHDQWLVEQKRLLGGSGN